MTNENISKQKKTSELRPASLNNIDIDKINKYWKRQNSQYSNSYPEVVIKCKFLSGKHNRESYSAYGEFFNKYINQKRKPFNKSK